MPRNQEESKIQGQAQGLELAKQKLQQWRLTSSIGNYFYRTEVGAVIADLLMSIIQTCNLAKVNAFEHLVNIQKNAGEVLLNPEQWLPWNYKTAGKI